MTVLLTFLFRYPFFLLPCCLSSTSRTMLKENIQKRLSVWCGFLAYYKWPMVLWDIFFLTWFVQWFYCEGIVNCTQCIFCVSWILPGFYNIVYHLSLHIFELPLHPLDKFHTVMGDYFVYAAEFRLTVFIEHFYM